MVHGLNRVGRAVGLAAAGWLILGIAALGAMADGTVVGMPPQGQGAGLPGDRVTHPVTSPGTSPPEGRVFLVSGDGMEVVLELINDQGPVAAGPPLAARDLFRALGWESSPIVRPGEPLLPSRSVLVAVPPRGEISLAVDSMPWQQPLASLPDLHRVPRGLSSELQPGQWEDDLTRRAPVGLYPVAPVTMEEPVWLRDRRLVRVVFWPVQVDFGQGVALVHSRIRVTLRFSGAPPQSDDLGLAAAGHRQEDPFDAVLRAGLINYEQARAWRGRPAATGSGEPAQGDPAQSSAAVKMRVSQDGFYRVTGAQLAAVGVDLAAARPHRLALAAQGSPVALQVEGGEDGVLDPDDALIFYGEAFRGQIGPESGADFFPCPHCGPQDLRIQPMESTYTRQNVYWLTWQEGGPQMAQQAVTPPQPALPNTSYPTFFTHTVRVEESRYWWTYHFTSKETWFADRLLAPSGRDVTTTVSVSLPAPAAVPFSATVQGEVVAFSPGTTHRARLSINDHEVALESWAGRTRVRLQGRVEQSRLTAQPTRISLTLLNGQSSQPDSVVPDWFDVTYARDLRAEGGSLTFAYDHTGPVVYTVSGFATADLLLADITDPQAPILLTGGLSSPTPDGANSLTFGWSQAGMRRLVAVERENHGVGLLAPADLAYYPGPELRRENRGADYLIITHSSFAPALQPLVDYRSAQGLRVAVIDVAQIYDEFNAGIVHPRAIRDFLAYAYVQWQAPPPAYALLVGDGHWNFHGYNPQRYGSPEPITMPPMLARVDPWQGEVDSTHLLAAVVGDDLLPDLAIGRFVVDGPEDVTELVQRTLAYEQAGYQGWHHRHAFVADDVPDPAGDFVGLAEGLIQGHLPDRLMPIRLYANHFGSGGSVDVAGVRGAIVDTVNVTGVHFLNYIGHGAIDRWAQEGYFTPQQVLQLDNGNRLPVVVSMDCLDAYWIYPNQPSLAELLLGTPGRGGVAVFGPTGLGVAAGHDILHRALYDGLFAQGILELGHAAIFAKLVLYQAGAHYDLIHTFTVFGDPALRIRQPDHARFLPILTRR